ncbi:MAG: YdcF family protein [Candidatus Pacebacteria bacterium]|nr:YdcF family protein [Candidatus Paceibacterota bacterium]
MENKPVVTLVLGRDMNEAGTDIGPKIALILEAAVAYQRSSGTILVVAPGHNPNFPDQPKTYAEMMADHLRVLGAGKVEVLEADHFSTFGELSALYRFCQEQDIEKWEVFGQRWHLKRAVYEARGVNPKWAARLQAVPTAGAMSWFDLLFEPLKWLKLILPRRWQVKAIAFWRRYISRRTSY